MKETRNTLGREQAPMLEERFYPISHAHLKELILNLKDFEKIDDQYSRLQHLISLPGCGDLTFERVLSFVHPDDRERILSAAQQAQQSDQSLQVEYRVMRPDGSVRWTVARGRLHTGAAGEPDRLMGVSAPDGFEQVRLTDSFPVVQPSYVLNDLLATAAQVNPNLLAAEASSEATRYNLNAVKSEYFPTLRAGATWAGYTQEYTDENSLLDQAYGSASASGQLFLPE